MRRSGPAPDDDAPAPLDTAFPGTMAAVRAAYATVPLDDASLARPLRPCDVASCHGQCCTEGVGLNAEELMVLRRLVRREAAFLASLGVGPADALLETDGPVGTRDVPDDAPPDADPDDAVGDDDDAPAPGGRTAVRVRPQAEVPDDYPPRFAHAACAFLVADGRCALQVLAVERGHHPWWAKPLACWLHPLSLAPDRIHLPDAATDRWGGAEGPGFASVTRCGRTMPEGRPAREVLAPELAQLERILGRSFAAEAGGE